MTVREDWLGRWQAGRTGWHEPAGNAALKEFWPALPPGSRVLVPLCGKAPDLAWLAQRGLHVTGVELSPLAIEAFFAEQGMAYRCETADRFVRYVAEAAMIELWCGDFFDFSAEPFDAVFDRGSLIALPRDTRFRYAKHCDALLRPGAYRLLVTLEYDQSQVAGPPFSVPADEVRAYWPSLQRLDERDDIDNAPPKFHEAGVDRLLEVVWATPGYD